jgi:exodeoxyribonuclease-1
MTSHIHPYMRDISRTFLFIDYETFNAQPKGGRPSQFAAIRTDKDLNILKDRSVNLFCEQIIDHLPSPTASRITSLTPQKILRFKSGLEFPSEGNVKCGYEVLNEYYFTKRILSEMSQPNTCTLGYNNIVFDDEFTRNLAYRNLFDPYRHEWDSGNSRFDVYNLVLATYVLMPHLLKFPIEKNIEGNDVILNEEEVEKVFPSFRLEKLSVANGINHGSAHDAFSDVEATIGIMKLILDKDSDFFYRIYSLRKKDNVDLWLMDHERKSKPFLHVSSFYGKENHCLAVLMILNVHPKNKNARICLNLSSDIKLLLQLPIDEIRDRLFKASEELKINNMERPGIVILKINQCPILAEVQEVSERMSELGLDSALLRLNLNLVNEFEDELRNKLWEIFNVPYQENNCDTDLMIYSGGFFSPSENLIKQKVHIAAEVNGLKEFDYSQSSDRLNQMIFKFKARNFPESLNEDELAQWREYSLARITKHPQIKGLYNFEEFNEELQRERANSKNDSDISLLNELEEYANELKRIHSI